MKLFKHQEDVLNQTSEFNRCAYYLDMGLGKTFVGSEKMMQLNKKVNLVVCQKSKVSDWVEHFNENYDISVWDLTQKKGIEFFFDDIQYDIQCVGVINYDLIWRRKYFLYLTDFTMLLDESSLIQNRTTKKSKYILKLKPQNVILLSGTPVGGKYENLWTQIHLLGWNISEDLYNKQYVNWKLIDVGGFKHKVVDMDNPYKNVDRLKSKLVEHGSVFMKTEEAFDLPAQTFVKVEVGTSKEYKKFNKTSIVTVEDDELVGDTSLTKLLYLRQLCGHYSKEKLEAFEDLIESTNDRLIVFYNFNKELERLLKICEDHERPVSLINGNVKDMKNYEQRDDSITFVQYQAGSMGLNLQKANKIVYFTLPLSSELFEQSKKRIHRIGQEKPCFYYIMMCRHSVEEQILETLEERKDFTDELFKKKCN